MKSNITTLISEALHQLSRVGAPLTYKQRYLAKLRAWIDRQLPRDVLRITIYSIPEGPEDTVAILLDTTHPEAILNCKMRESNNAFTFKGRVMVSFHTEHLSP